MAKDLYSVLGVSRKADEKEIRSAYRKLARKLHPDVNPNDKAAEAKFKEVSQAHEVLGNPEKRKLYDQYGEHWEQAGQFQGGVPGQDFTYQTGPSGGGFESIFEQFFGGGRGNRIHFEDLDAAQPRDVEKSIELPLEEVDTGTKRVLTYQTMDAQRTREGIATVPSTKKVEVTIPAGIPDGKKLRVPGKGGAGANGKAGDLYVTVKWAPNSQFKLVEEHLEVEVPVPFTVAALGGEIRVPTLKSVLTMKIPEGTQSGQVFRLASQGIAKLSGGKCDLMARIKITVPKKPTEEQRRLLEQLAEIDGAAK
ncbi:MAG: J domain-containing protein [Chlorobia bacterium]|nr:J domain-containing protein [Fimbriimonadaceae bacterium]